MPTVQEKIATAKAAGYSDDDIAGHLAAMPEYTEKFKTAKAAGYKASDIISHLSTVSKASDQIPATPRAYPVSANDIKRGAELAAPERTYKDDNLLGNLVGPVDAGMSMLASLAGAAIAPTAGFAQSIITGQGEPEKNASKIAERFQRSPSTGTGAQLLEMAGKALGPLGALPSAAALEGATAIGQGSAAARGAMAGSGTRIMQPLNRLAQATNAPINAADAAIAAGGKGKLSDLIRAPQPVMAGVGAAATDLPALRVAAADQLPVPMGSLMTKGMRTRAKPDLAFENIAAKDTELGAGLRDRTVKINQAALDNFDAFADATGAQGSGLRPTGKVVDDYLVKRVTGAKTDIRKAYTDAKQSVEGKIPADTGPLLEYLDKYAAEAKTGNAPVLNTVRSMIEELDPKGTGKIPLADFNEIRERVGRISPEGSPNAPYRKDLQGLVDGAVEANGGPLYRSARRMVENYKNEFENAGALDRLLRTKPGTKDRAVALEDIVTKSTLDAPSTDAVRQVKSTLTRKQDPEGLQAWKEMQGETARQMKERVLGEGRTELTGAREVLPGKLSKMVREMDADGRLEVIFGKNGAQKWRDLADTVSEMKTLPGGTVSSSGTAEVLAGLLDTAVSGTTGLPLPIASTLNYAAKKVRKNIKTRKIDAALNPDAPPKQSFLRDLAGRAP